MVIPIPRHPNFTLEGFIHKCLEEDLGDRGDLTSLATVGDEVSVTGKFVAKEAGILAGIQVANAVFEIVDKTITVKWTKEDGDSIAAGDVGTTIGSLEGPARSVLIAERLALNLLQRMSGIATYTAEMVGELKGTPSTLLDTRKTAPGMRVLDKWAVLLGGAQSHRMGLYDMMMIKDNHIAAAGGITKALTRADAYLDENEPSVPVEIEVENLDQVNEVMEYKRNKVKTHLTRVMLDNMVLRKTDASDGQSGICYYDTSLLKECVHQIGNALETEASGNITKDSIQEVGKTGVLFISSGALTHSVKALDISLRIHSYAKE